jgi:hypothetical protein
MHLLKIQGVIKMKKVAILTKYYKNYNYGGMLQGYALHRVISEMGKSCDIISYDVSLNSNPVYTSLIQQCKQYGVMDAVSKIKEKFVGKLKFFIRTILKEREDLFCDFMKEINANTKLYSDESLHKLNDEYEVFISGSDQVWNPNAVRKLYLQDFVRDEKIKVAYAASIGRSELSEFEAEKIISLIGRFDHLGVREKTAKSLLQRHIKNDIKVVLDPTLLISASGWETIAAPRAVKQQYALFYFFSDSLKIRKKVKSFCEDHDLVPVIIPYAKQEFNFGDSKETYIQLEHVGPKEFVSAIKYADYVFTDSFHGAVFSIIHHKQFIVFERNKDGHVSMNSRLHDLLELFDLKNRIINLEQINEMKNMNAIDYVALDYTLNELKQKSMDYLKYVLDDKNCD